MTAFRTPWFSTRRARAGDTGRATVEVSDGVESQYVPMSDTGLFYIYAGVDLDA